MGSSHGFDNGTAPEDDDPQRCTHLRHEDAPNGELPLDCPRVARRGRIVSPAAVSVANKTLWICRCAWTTLMRRPQLHRAHIGKLLIWIGKRTSEGWRGDHMRRQHVPWRN